MSKGRGAVLDMVVDYCAGAMDAEPRAEFERHLAHCDECTAMVAAQREVWESLDQWGQADVPEVSPDFDARLYARIAHEQTAPAWRRWLNSLLPAAPGSVWKPSISAISAISILAACAVLAIGLRTASWMDLATARGPQPAQNTAQMEGGHMDIHADTHVDIEQVANALDELDLLMPASHGTPTSAVPPRVM
jgi:anti-sigma-K factor RskA